MFADFDYYINNYKGTKIKTLEEYQHFGQKASMYIKKYATEVSEETKSCECAISEYLQDCERQGNMTSESIPNAYSVSWSANDSKTQLKEINSILRLYLGNKYSPVGIVKIVY